MSASNNPIIAQQTADRKENQQPDKRPVAHSSLFVGGPREENATIQTPVAVLTGDVRRGEKFLDVGDESCYLHAQAVYADSIVRVGDKVTAVAAPEPKGQSKDPAWVDR